MVFNSIGFLVFFPTVVALYFRTPHRWRWALLLTASCIFYMAFIPIYILILGFTIVIDYSAGLWIASAEGRARKFALTASIVANVGVLGVFKYYNFFAGNMSAVARAVDWNYSPRLLAIALPIGLSFHTFQAMAYTIEIYRGRYEPERHFGIFALYVMFFPQLVAGPIERPRNLLPQFRERHDFDYDLATNGLKLMMWGFFKKTVIADRLAPIVNDVYAQPSKFAPAILVVATVLFAFQIYCDFSGYSDIAVGSAQVMGFRLMTNFRRPYAARTVSEFWRRWHISLSTWFRDYIYIPLKGGRDGITRVCGNLVFVFFLSGLWHGANWTFLAWGGLHGLYVAGERVLRLSQAAATSVIMKYAQWMTTFAFVVFAWVFFRAQTIGDALLIAGRLPAGVVQLASGVVYPAMLWSLLINTGVTYRIIVPIVSIIIMEVVQCRQERGSVRTMLSTRPIWQRWALYYAITAWVLLFGRLEAEQFIYFQF